MMLDGGCGVRPGKCMPLKLSWADLIIEDIEPEYAFNCLREWGGLVSGQVPPVFLSKFGDWYLRRPDGTTHKLDVLSGTLTVIADSPEEFRARVNTQEWQEEHLLSRLVYELHRHGRSGPGQCFAVAPHRYSAGGLSRHSSCSWILTFGNLYVTGLQQACGLSKEADGNPRGKWWQLWHWSGRDSSVASPPLGLRPGSFLPIAMVRRRRSARSG